MEVVWLRQKKSESYTMYAIDFCKLADLRSIISIILKVGHIP